MNIFFLDPNPKICAQYHNSKHVVKMILELSQLLSTAHRVLDGKETLGLSASGRKAKRWLIGDKRDDILYAATHMNHPSAIWCRANNENYLWLHSLLVELCVEYTYRYGKVHKCQQIGLVDSLGISPNNILIGKFTEPTTAMPDDVKVPGDSLSSYRNYYINNKVHLANWNGKVNSRSQPEWFK